jgi:hypothetical protein
VTVPEGWYAFELAPPIFDQLNRLIVANTSDYFDTLSLEDYPEIITAELSVVPYEQSPYPVTSSETFTQDYLNGASLDFDTDFLAEVAYGGRQVISYYSYGAESYFLVAPLDAGRYLEAIISATPENFANNETLLIAILESLTPLSLNSSVEESVVTDESSLILDATHRSLSEKIQFDYPSWWFVDETTQDFFTEIRVVIPSSPDVDVRGDDFFAYQQVAEAIVYISLTEPTPFVEWTNAVDYVMEQSEPAHTMTIGFVEDRESFAYRLLNGSGWIVVGRSDGTLVQVRIENRTSNDQELAYTADYLNEVFDMLDTIRYPTVETLVEFTDNYRNDELDIELDIPRGWFVEVVNAGATQDGTPIPPNTVTFANLEAFDIENVFPGQVQVQVTVLPAIPGSYTPLVTPPGEEETPITTEEIRDIAMSGVLRQQYAPLSTRTVATRAESIGGEAYGVVLFAEDADHAFYFIQQPGNPYRFIEIQMTTGPGQYDDWESVLFTMLKSLR